MNQPNRTFYRAEASFCTQKIDSNNPDTKLELKCINYTMDYCNKMNISENFKKVKFFFENQESKITIPSNMKYFIVLMILNGTKIL